LNEGDGCSGEPNCTMFSFFVLFYLFYGLSWDGFVFKYFVVLLNDEKGGPC
jgi:uncharacterized iron-regulated membrane protein